jgi:hypothetical protein
VSFAAARHFLALMDQVPQLKAHIARIVEMRDLSRMS